MTGTLSEVAQACWADLAAAAASREEPFRTPVLSTAGLDGAPEARTVVLRAVDPARRALTLFTDSRSAKWAELAADPRAGLVFYDPARQVQLRLAGTAALHRDDETARAYWLAAPPAVRLPYLCQPGPGAALDAAGPGIAPPVFAGPLGEDTLAPGAAFFAVIVLSIHRLQWLSLRRMGNMAARFDWDERGALTAGWIVP
ncbi:pyridoxamine 5'-phosphate oxidase family protein [Iodidimonas sp. SYSU 1G8]|uniref:pyridoxamine 5'-phosphate oxidase family protein n=1 Tax=Iodidimonas sp. SYSU 1G8 TaxID=3133967 RepID=UPI0031FEB09B